MPSPENSPSRVFVLRLWREPEGGSVGAWRASLLNPVSRTRHFFSDPDQLRAYLSELDLQWPDEETEP